MFLPTRLIGIFDEKSVHQIQIKSEKSEKLNGLYVAFSHWWGKAKTLKLLHENKTRLQACINDTELPTTYREGLLVCR